MQSFKNTAWAVASLAVICGCANHTMDVFASSAAPVMQVPVQKAVSAAATVAALTPAAPVATPLATVAPLTAVAPVHKPVAPLVFDESLRAQMKFERVRLGDKVLQTLDEPSRILLAKAAARKARLHEVGLSYEDVYGIIEAETSWIPRTGASKDGTANLGLAQFEPNTAERMGIVDPGDPLQAVFGAALYMRTGAKWASGKLKGLKLRPDEYASKVREGVSVHYNLSVKGRNKWDGRNTLDLPIETQRHISNARAGAAEAAQLARLLKT
ncbi:lytic transglycosylase domain-containing protein [Caenimonas sedimenti]|uniref:Lytic transglycosylase domain-containing protein n=1 Tax=Caenimonas sedimenti TaxID=2596921 RepID=A0A562ZE49_9BURK|nr:lytic transglycosylase domain-containing protein [Caenimonas sedimenti]TWO64906.1 lytic transglycosylase domain-containing protein [Caenimonas sedimenti]